MAYGFTGSRENWEDLEAPLRVIDPVLSSFARENDLVLSKSDSNWPQRSLSWHEGFGREVSLFPTSHRKAIYSLRVVASFDRGGKRYWKSAEIEHELPANELPNRIEGLLKDAFEICSSWTIEDLQENYRIGKAGCLSAVGEFFKKLF